MYSHLPATAARIYVSIRRMCAISSGDTHTLGKLDGETDRWQSLQGPAESSDLSRAMTFHPNRLTETSHTLSPIEARSPQSHPRNRQASSRPFDSAHLRIRQPQDSATTTMEEAETRKVKTDGSSGQKNLTTMVSRMAIRRSLPTQLARTRAPE